uniref:epoxide hydrolase 1-like n=1 Tax=Jaculus jaculus TaxID=51337 RepID=UPI001E1B5291|nr:epoxide hydrolase 1-like [Jaculus jaculus]
MWLELLLASVLGLVIYWFFSRDKEESLPLEDGWWGPGAKPTSEEDESIHPFKVDTSDEEIEDLYQRIDKFRGSPPLEGSRFHYGFNSNYLKKIVSYWRNEFDWRKQVEMLNKYPHFKTNIADEGLCATDFAAFPCEILHTPEKCVKKVKHPKLISYSYMERGGHFPALEEPKLLAQDIHKFVSLVERQ